MSRKSFGVVSIADIHGIRVAFILILFWIGIWNLTEELVRWVEMNDRIERRKQSMGLVFISLLLIILDPYTFEK